MEDKESSFRAPGPVKVDAKIHKHTVKVHVKASYKKKIKRKYARAYYKKKVKKRKHAWAYTLRYTTRRHVGASHHEVNPQWVEASGRCSCSLHTDYREHTSRFRNYCPFCGSHGKLAYEEGPTCPEGMWVCRGCDADFCLVHGKSHTSRAKYLSRV